MKKENIELTPEAFLNMLESLPKPPGGGENPYLYIARQIGIEEEVLKQIEIFGNTPSDPRAEKEAAYKTLIDWEVGEYPLAFKRTFGRLPVKGNLEALLPASKATQEATVLIPQLKEKGIKTAIVSSGFQSLVKPAALELGIDENQVHANRFLYDKETNLLSGIEINVSGNKIGAIDKAITIFKEDGVDVTNIAYVGDNNWDKGAIKHILDLGGKVFYLRPGNDEDLKGFPFSELELLDNDNVTIIENLSVILENSDGLTAIIYDADGTIINT